jgi:hypothetical protein
MTSKGSAKTKSTGPSTPTVSKVIEKVTSGFGFLAGHVTKITGSVMFTPGTGQNCVTTDISTLTFTNTTNVVFSQS